MERGVRQGVSEVGKERGERLHQGLERRMRRRKEEGGGA